jgi:hypothetical protein
LIARPYLDVEVRIVSAGACEFIASLANGQTVGTAIAQASAKIPDFDLVDCFNVLISANIVVGLAQLPSM